ncbi:charged multivesicular body protein 3 [Trichuris trichiura]|uniref:Charged multivesicular body protein 3 n=1 Tax=Trichuris trichiura TaxID=36087 RepID=A0A077Z992_TRITR|nr:charged multivesicular body protein 3 [Trichuris trichiura]
MNLFGLSKPRSDKDYVRDLCRRMNQEARQIDRQIHAIQRQEAKVKQAIKASAARGEMDACKVLAKEIVQSRKAVARMYQTKAHISSISLYMKNQASSATMVNSVQRSTEAVKSMQYLVNLPECATAMRELSREMIKAGIIEEMMEDTVESVLPEVDEDELQEEVDKVLNEVVAGTLSRAPAAASHALESKEAATTAENDKEAAQVEADLEAMRARLEALRE